MSQIDLKKIHTLKQQIAAGRQRLQILWNNHGCADSGSISDADILAASIELDDLMNQYQKLTS